MQVKISNVQFKFESYSTFGDFANTVQRIFKDIPLDSDYVLFPELVTIGLLTTYEDYHTFTSQDNSKLVNFLNDYIELFNTLSTARNQVIIAGSTLEQEGLDTYNTAYIFDGKGNYAKHRKTHIFPAESDWDTKEGNILETFDIGPVRIGVAICYEIEIPEIATLYSRQGADIIFCPSYTFTEHGFWRVRHCAEARCIENQLYVIHSPIIGEVDGVIETGFGNSANLSPCELPWTSNGLMEECTTSDFEIITSILEIDTLYDKRKSGVATTYYDRKRRNDLYQNYNM